MKVPTNQKAQVLWYLKTMGSLNLKDVIVDSMFFKFQSRLSDIEIEMGRVIANRVRIKFTNKFGRKSTYVQYTLDIPHIEFDKLYERFNG